MGGVRSDQNVVPAYAGRFKLEYELTARHQAHYLSKEDVQQHFKL
jgi:hypothetical protein